ncbi:MAG: 4-alpha-glucanotransferase [Eubacteriales bacterium]
MQRSSGVLLHITSLPGRFGIGTLGKEAYDFIDLLKAGGQSHWQVLPLNPTGFANSPYQGVSAFAGNPYLISLESLVEIGLLKKEDLPKVKFKSNNKVDYEFQSNVKGKILKKAYENFKLKDTAFLGFKEKEAFWLEDYALFMAVKEYFSLNPFWKWEKDIANKEKSASSKYLKKLSDEVEFYKFEQYIFFIQWRDVKNYANKNGIKIIGDLPFYVARDSVDYWANRELFDKSGRMSGCPPDTFCKNGQLWENPIYDFDTMALDGFKWWVMRFTKAKSMYDLIRIDHFRGFEAFYAVESNMKDAVKGKWIKGPSYTLFDKIMNQVGKLPVIAEDLGNITKEVHELLGHYGYPGTKVLQFAFDKSKNSMYLPYNYKNNCVVYTGTHDNNTAIGWFVSLDDFDKKFFIEYTGDCEVNDVSKVLIRLAYSSVADLAIIPVQDILKLPGDARMNTPGTIKGNWEFKLEKGQFSKKHADELLLLAETYGRIIKN